MGCVSSYCPYKEVPHYYCDKCGEEILQAPYATEEYEHLCKDCYVEITGVDEDEL